MEVETVEPIPNLNCTRINNQSVKQYYNMYSEKHKQI